MLSGEIAAAPLGEAESIAARFFDASFYLTKYPMDENVRRNPLDHYLTTGWLYGYDPSPEFSTRHYLSSYPDVRQSGENPLVHYARIGRSQGRHGRELNSEQLAVESAFDTEYYLFRYPDIRESTVDPLIHYCDVGWKQGRDPSPEFNTNHYLERNPDIRLNGIHPFVHFVLHGRAEGRDAADPIHRMIRATTVRVSVIVPCFNHAEFIAERLTSIFEQTYRPHEIIVLDDASTDDSVAKIKAAVAKAPVPTKLITSAENSGSVFEQWRKGLAEATGDVIWVCESDDLCEPDFLANLVWMFNDESVMVAFGRIQFCDRRGAVINGLDSIREGAEPGIWGKPIVQPAATWFKGALGVRNVIANVGGCLFRNVKLTEEIWRKARTFRILGDWFLYMHLVGGGAIGYSPAAIAYFRQHGLNTSVKAFESPQFYEEHQELHTILRRRWTIPDETSLRFFQAVRAVFEGTKLAKSGRRLSEFISLDRLLEVQREETHIVLSSMNFSIGGGELLPVNIANELKRRGCLVSFLVQNSFSDNSFLRKSLDPSIPVYESTTIPRPAASFADRIGASVIHSHNIWSELFFFNDGERLKSTRYLVTLHGSYEVSNIPDSEFVKVIKGVDDWVYTSKRNLQFFDQYRVDKSIFVRLKNGMPIRRSPTPVTRKDLGISQDAVVFVFVARSHPDKGWLECAEAFAKSASSSKRKTVLLMVGEGAEAERVRQRFGDNADIRMLGFRSDVDDLLAISDCCVIPSRFAGESMPLILIQSLLNEVPIIATDVGDIPEMIRTDDAEAGLLIETATAGQAEFIDKLAQSMLLMTDDDVRRRYAEGCRVIGPEYSIERCVDRYLEFYSSPAAESVRPKNGV